MALFNRQNLSVFNDQLSTLQRDAALRFLTISGEPNYSMWYDKNMRYGLKTSVEKI
jgi:hypothetical protein